MKSLAEHLGVIDPLLDADEQQTDEQCELRASELASIEMTAESFCRDILNTVQYRESLLRRILMDTLPPAVECLLYHYAHGKPVERMEHTGKDGAPIVTQVRRVVVRPSATFDDQFEQTVKLSVTH